MHIMGKKIAFKTLGCRLNQYETDALVSDFINAGYEVVDFGEEADAVIINTCTVTNMSDKKSRQELNKALRIGDKTLVVATGCMVTHYKNSQLLDSITYVVDNTSKADIFSLIDGHFKGELIPVEALAKDHFKYNPVEVGFHTRSLIKIQDGCNNFCTFCIVPFVRGRAISRPKVEIMENIRKVLDFGYHEIVLTGVNIGRYDDQGLDFESLVEEILSIEGDFRVRISSIEPEGFGEKLFDLFQHPKLTPHIHACLQSGSDKILKAMRRNYSLEDFIKMTDSLKNRIGDFNFTTDIIVGFPGETDDDFERTLDAIHQIGFSHIHTFKYSIRNGTRAARFPEQVHGSIKHQRSELVRKVAKEQKLAYRKSMIGKKQRVLIEKLQDRTDAIGYGEHYFPIRVANMGKSALGCFYEVIVKDVLDDEERTVLATRIN